MKISLAWISEYFKNNSLSGTTPEVIMSRFNQVTAEMESSYTVTYPLDNLAVAKIVSISQDSVEIIIPEWNNQKIELSQKKSEKVSVDETHLVLKDGSGIRWATSSDLLSEKDFALPAFYIPESQHAGLWKERIDQDEVMFEIDNKSITNRPDLWGHYGCAREIASFLQKELIPFNQIASSIKKSLHAEEGKVDGTNITIKNRALDQCSVYTACYIPESRYQASDIAMAFRLIRVGAKPMQAMVDITNYVLYDLGQPMHAYSSNDIVGDLSIRHAEKDEKVLLLSDIDLTLTQEDVVIADQEKVLCLAGIKGAKFGSMTHEDHPVLLEAATFHASTIRRSALRHKIRTESSSRFEKTLDEERTVASLQRFLFLAEQQGICKKQERTCLVVGKIPDLHQIIIKHSFLLKRSGIDLTEDHVVKPLEAMEFSVAVKSVDQDREYTITVPSFRASKDVRIKEDILEEVVRHYGFDRIPMKLPPLVKKPGSIGALVRLRMIKRYLASKAAMIEQVNYAYIDDRVMEELGWVFDNPVQMLNPVAENQKTMIQSLLPGLLKNIIDNRNEADQLRFFEIGRCIKFSDDSIVETKKISAVFFNKRGEIDFYQCKAVIESLFALCGMKDVEWKQISEKKEVWMRPYRTASLWWQGELLGYAGMVNAEMLRKLDGLDETSAFCFELLLDPLLKKREQLRYEPVSKYQGTSFDLACMVPRMQTVASLELMITSLDKQIIDVTVFDFYEKKEWKDVRSIGLRVWMQSNEQTLTKEMIDAVRAKILEKLASHGITLRT
ncbi:phenylalanine--tRNA ligase subunit beta [Candidatus Babeliales bacterium]|nr:phenylalanine--tRNA ligase subunit beta [Candidatus Babeliales bacterium]